MAHYRTPTHRRFAAVQPTASYRYGRGFGQAELDDAFYFEEEDVYAPPPPAPKKRRSGPKRKPGRAVKCKVVTTKAGRRKLCWDKRGLLTSNTKPGAKRKGKKVKCKTKCPKGTRKVCTGGYHRKKGSKKRVCRKFTCKRKR